MSWKCACFINVDLFSTSSCTEPTSWPYEETYLGDRTVRAEGFHCFYNRRHLGQTILVREILAAPEVDMPKWDSNALQVHAVRVQIPAPLVIVSMHASDGKVEIQRWRSLFALKENIIFCGDFNARVREWDIVITKGGGGGGKEIWTKRRCVLI